MSGVRSVDFAGASALAAAVRPVPGQCQVIVRSLRPDTRRKLELIGLDLSQPEPGSRQADQQPRSRAEAMAASPTGILVREWQHLISSVEHAVAESYRTARALAATEDRVAVTFQRLAARRPAASARLAKLSRTASEYAAVLRAQQRDGTSRAALVSPSPLPTSGTIRLAVAFIEERARDDIGIADIAAAAFVTTRAVQLAFRRYLGTTPMRYLRQVRLERAHDQLLSADPDRSTVTAVAADWRFANPSRFTAYYRAAYGVPPTHTLRQRHPGD